MTGWPSGMSERKGLRLGIDAFVDEERGSTTLAAAVAILVSLVLVFGLANASWTASCSADVQAVADAGALAGMNALASYVTTAQVVDSLVLSMGLVGLTTMAVGLVLSAIPGTSVAGPPVVSAANSVLKARASLSRSAAKGLQQLEKAVPLLVAASSYAVIEANLSEEGSYVGLALPFPLESETDFGLITQGDALEQGEQLEESSEELEGLERQASESKGLADAALERAWRADCRDEPNCLRERAATLAGLSGLLNPDYPSMESWNFAVPIERARAYYRARIAQEAPESSDPLELTRSRARAAFYDYALEQVGASSFAQDASGYVTCDLRELPANTEEVRRTRLYTDVVWPTTMEGQGRTIHSDAGCPGATGASAGLGSLAEQDGGALLECPTCQFTVADVGRAPSASTNIENGFEHHWREIVRASEEYEAARNEQIAQEQEAWNEAQEARNVFAEALEALKVARVELAPPGRYGCLCVVADPIAHLAPDDLATLVGSGAQLPPRVAVSAAVLARDPATRGNTVLAGFFDALVAQGGFVGGAGVVLDGVLSAWGEMLLAYSDAYEAFTNIVQGAMGALRLLGGSSVAARLSEAIDEVVGMAGLQPADLSSKKPVLTNSSDVMTQAGHDWYAVVQALALAVPALSADNGVVGMLEALDVFVETLPGITEITVAELTIPGTDVTVPLTIDLRWLLSLAGGEGGA